jgi:hypothetical protein
LADIRPLKVAKEAPGTKRVKKLVVKKLVD